MVSEAQKRASAKYEAQNVRRVTVKFYPSEEDLWEYLELQSNRMGYIKSLIRRDLENARAAERYLIVWEDDEMQFVDSLEEWQSQVQALGEAGFEVELAGNACYVNADYDDYADNDSDEDED
ncbi:MAG: hypothetical protein PUE49_03835 [Eggerthellales bacterium]|nr:hypothetical protein [Eggerthellales bacterium]